jgi:hypothetical protein
MSYTRWENQQWKYRLYGNCNSPCSLIKDLWTRIPSTCLTSWHSPLSRPASRCFDFEMCSVVVDPNQAFGSNTRIFIKSRCEMHKWKFELLRKVGHIQLSHIHICTTSNFKQQFLPFQIRSKVSTPKCISWDICSTHSPLPGERTSSMQHSPVIEYYLLEHLMRWLLRTRPGTSCVQYSLSFRRRTSSHFRMAS